jgi:hypothetical protein
MVHITHNISQSIKTICVPRKKLSSPWQCTGIQLVVYSPQQLFFLLISYIKTKDDECLEVEDKVAVAQYKEAYSITVLNLS